MNIVLAVESLKSPLTGIGKYAWELASRLSGHFGIHSVEYLAHGRWKTFDSLVRKITPKETSHSRKLSPRLPNFIQQTLVSKVYENLAPILAKTAMRAVNADLFHGPNYFVPKLDIPCAVTVHDLSFFVNSDWHPPARIRRMNKLLPQSIENSKLIITDSEAMRDEVIAYYGLSAEKVIAVPLGVDSIFKPRAPADIELILAQFALKAGGYSLFVSTIEPRKNLLALLSAYRSLPAQIRERWPLVLIGERGWNSELIHQKIKQSEKEGWLKYLGFVPKKTLPLFYSGSHLFVYPSLYEGFGLPIGEAMASGVPVLTSDRSSMPEVAKGAALLVNPEDEDAIRRGLLQGLEDETWRSLAIAKGLKRAAELTWESCVEGTIQAYHSILE